MSIGISPQNVHLHFTKIFELPFHHKISIVISPQIGLNTHWHFPTKHTLTFPHKMYIGFSPQNVHWHFPTKCPLPFPHNMSTFIILAFPHNMSIAISPQIGLNTISCKDYVIWYCYMSIGISPQNVHRHFPTTCPLPFPHK